MIQLRCICSIYSNLVPLTSKEMIDFHTLSYTSTVKSLFYYALEARKTQYSFQVQSFSILGHYREYLSGSFLLIGSYIIIPEERIHIKREQKCCQYPSNLYVYQQVSLLSCISGLVQESTIHCMMELFSFLDHIFLVEASMYLTLYYIFYIPD